MHSLELPKNELTEPLHQTDHNVISYRILYNRAILIAHSLYSSFPVLIIGPPEKIRTPSLSLEHSYASTATGGLFV